MSELNLSVTQCRSPSSKDPTPVKLMAAVQFSFPERWIRVISYFMLSDEGLDYSFSSMRIWPPMFIPFCV